MYVSPLKKVTIGSAFYWFCVPLSLLSQWAISLLSPVYWIESCWFRFKYVCSYCICSFETIVFYRLHHINNNSIISALWRVIIVGGCMTLALLVCIGRVYLHYHTTYQVFIGSLVGCLFATIWFIIVHRIFTPLFPQLVSLWVSLLLLWYFKKKWFHVLSEHF